jgi:hypothetical protein
MRVVGETEEVTMAMGVNNYGIPGAYVPPTMGGQAAPGMTAAPPSYGMDAYQPGVPVAPGGYPNGAAPQQQKGPNLMMIAGLAIGGFMLFGPVGAIVGGLIGLLLK